MIAFMKDELFFRYYSDLASRIKVFNHTAAFIVKSDIHSEATINVVKRFADVIIENRERSARKENRTRSSRQHQNGQFSTEWERIPMPRGLRSRFRHTEVRREPQLVKE